MDGGPWVGYSPWGRKGSHMTERLSTAQHGLDSHRSEARPGSQGPGQGLCPTSKALFLPANHNLLSISPPLSLTHIPLDSVFLWIDTCYASFIWKAVNTAEFTELLFLETILWLPKSTVGTMNIWKNTKIEMKQPTKIQQRGRKSHFCWEFCESVSFFLPFLPSFFLPPLSSFLLFFLPPYFFVFW